jgi:hypothetical protein
METNQTDNNTRRILVLGPSGAGKSAVLFNLGCQNATSHNSAVGTGIIHIDLKAETEDTHYLFTEMASAKTSDLHNPYHLALVVMLPGQSKRAEESFRCLKMSLPDVPVLVVVQRSTSKDATYPFELETFPCISVDLPGSDVLENSSRMEEWTDVRRERLRADQRRLWSKIQELSNTGYQPRKPQEIKDEDLPRYTLKLETCFIPYIETGGKKYYLSTNWKISPECTLPEGVVRDRKDASPIWERTVSAVTTEKKKSLAEKLARWTQAGAKIPKSYSRTVFSSSDEKGVSAWIATHVSESVALDTEFGKQKGIRCVQICSSKTKDEPFVLVVVFTTQEKTPPTSLASLLISKCTKYMVDQSQDKTHLATLGMDLKNVVDLQDIAKEMGAKDKLSKVRMLELTGQAPQSPARTIDHLSWDQDELDDSQISYAADDVFDIWKLALCYLS